ncbi:uricase-like [Daphnia pulicaria]|uniref:uricase-like n=1 Tax=Daphnia pulicaria TaxID=35523 RepID=UPI001EEB21AB|nr:uricase-like [Daphnia pulicaria]XP_046643713.1 uricase-like [Daphnia pulicaria]XP_046643714.1 uricase-like [Daphnia pulicaria]XP_046643715.1 uricase-like [Daphnia pulicaria]
MSTYKIVDDAYGKSGVKLLHIKRDGPVHSIRELEVSSQLTLASKKDYTEGDNSDIVATDSQKNTVYLLAKKHGVNSPEEFAILLCRHYLSTYAHVLKAQVQVELYPWQRIDADGKKHNHAFVFTPVATRFCTARMEKNGIPTIESGLKDLRVLKTTQSSFVNFVNDDYRSLPDASDRVFSTVITSRWEYSTVNVDFCKAWNTVKDAIMKVFAGPADKGIYSPSVQNTLHLTEKLVLDSVPEINYIEMILPNKHYINVDLSKFKNVGFAHNDTVLQPLDKPSGNIRAALTRTLASKL